MVAGYLGTLGLEPVSREDFSVAAKEALAKRVGYRCSNPSCGAETVGPHSDAMRFSNLGVASHITAASPGGPRFDASLTTDQRVSIDNGVWLCQSCAKLIDSDVARYSAQMLAQWKVDAEAKALRAISGQAPLEFFPQPSRALHTPIPKIAGLRYVDARERLLRAGWQPFMNHWRHSAEPDMQYGNGLHFWSMGFHEIRNASGTGLAHCWFAFRDVYDNVLVVTTAGEVDESTGDGAYVWRWHFEQPDA